MSGDWADTMLGKGPQRPAAGPKNAKTTLYLPPEVMGAMDQFRLDLRADRGIILDRSALIAKMWEFVADLPEFGDALG